MSAERRRHPRVIGYAKALHLPGLAPGYLRDISSAGCQISLAAVVPAAVGDLAEFRVVPVHDPSIPPFRLSLRIKWVRADRVWFSIGGDAERLLNESDKQSFEQLLRYYQG